MAIAGAIAVLNHLNLFKVSNSILLLINSLRPNMERSKRNVARHVVRQRDYHSRGARIHFRRIEMWYQILAKDDSS